MGAEKQQWYPESKMYDQTGVHYSFPKDAYPNNERYHCDTLLKYHLQWDWLMPVCKKFDELDAKLNTNDYWEYEQLCDSLDNAVTSYELERVVTKLSECVKWHNARKAKLSEPKVE